MAMNNELLAIVSFIERERGVDREIVLVAIEQALQQLKDAHKSQDIAAVDSAMNNLNQVMQAASAQMYQGGAQAGPQPGADQNAGSQGGQQSQGAEDADFEEVK